MQIGKISREEREMVLMMRQVREEYPEGKLAMVLEKELDDDRIDGMIKGKSPCEYCQELAEGSCKGSEFGCRNWWLRFLTDDEKEKCRKRAFGDAVVEEKASEEATDGDGRASDGRGIGGCGEQADGRALGGGSQ